jgi:hypothetical protein
MSFDRVFMGADAVTAADGMCEADHAQTRLKELMARAATTSTSWRTRPSSACGRSTHGHGWRCLGLW